jgi:hypothetical protein
MSAKDPIRIFITHAFAEHEEYAQVFEYLESRDNFYYLALSDPEAQPSGEEETQETVRQQIKNAEIVVFPFGVHMTSPKLIDFELRVGQAFKKPILAIKSFGGTQLVSDEASQAADEVVEWNDRIITDAIRRLARGEDTARWDVIEFDMD